MDWSAIQVMTLMMPANEHNPRLEEAIQFLKGPDFVPTDSQPAQVEFNGSLHFRFPTPRPCEIHGKQCRSYRGPVAVLGTARHLAVAARTRRRVLWGRAGFAGTRPALAGATVEQACRCVLNT